MSAIWPLDLPPTQKFVLISLADQANDDGVCWPGNASLAVRTGFSERAVRGALRWLEANGYITTVSRPGRTSNYIISEPGSRCRPAGGAEVKPRQQVPGRAAAGAGEGGTPCRGGRQQVPPNPKEPKGTPIEPDSAPAARVAKPGDGFADFWASWPANERKQDKAKCVDYWRRNKLADHADRIMADIGLKARTRKWRDGFIEAPLVYLRGRRWEDGVSPGDAATEMDDLLIGEPA